MFNVYMMCYKADRTHQNSSRLSNIHYASINNKYMSEFIIYMMVLLHIQ